MKRFLKSKIFVVLLILVLFAGATVALSIFTGGGSTAAGNIIGVIVTPLEKGFTAITNGIGGFFGVFYENTALQNEVEMLRSQMRAMEDSIRDAERYKEENEELRRMFGIRQAHEDFVFEKAEIISRGNSNWSKVVTIDRGSLHGVSMYNCVITSDGFLGFISEVGSTWSEVTTVIDTKMEAGAMISRTRDVCVAEGDFELMKKGRFKLVYLSKDAEIALDDVVVTSGLGGLYPKDIVLGKIKKVGTEVHGVSKYAEVEPLFDLNQVTQVMVIKAFDVTD